MDIDFWKGRKVFLTGHTGFKGSWLSLWLQQMGAKVYGYSLQPRTNPNLYELARVCEGMRSVIGDVRDQSALNAAMQDARPEIVFHMAAQPLVLHSYNDPIETFEINVIGTAHLLESVRRCKSVKAVVNVTTDKCYENKEWEWPYRETDRLGGHDPYSSSKACSEMVTSCYRASFFNSQNYAEHGVAIATARSGNVIGGGDWSKNRLVPDILKSLELQQVVNIRNPFSVRPWQHVLDPLRGYLILAEKLINYGSEFSGSWNFGPNQFDIKTVGSLVDSICKKWGPNRGWQQENGHLPHEAKYLKLDTSKSLAYLQWKPIIDLEQAIEMTVKWHHAYISKNDIKQYTLDQIIQYKKIQ